MATIIEKKINGYGPYLYRVTTENGETHWEYLGRADGKGAYDVRDRDGDRDELKADEIDLESLVDKIDPAEAKSLREHGVTAGETVADDMLVAEVDSETIYITPKDAYETIDVDNTDEDQIRRSIFGSKLINEMSGLAPETVEDENYIYQKGIEGKRLDKLSKDKVNTDELAKLYASSAFVGEIDVDGDNIIVDESGTPYHVDTEMSERDIDTIFNGFNSWNFEDIPIDWEDISHKMGEMAEERDNKEFYERAKEQTDESYARRASMNITDINQGEVDYKAP